MATREYFNCAKPIHVPLPVINFFGALRPRHVFTLLLLGANAVAQTAAASFTYGLATFPTREQAEAAMRADPDYAGIGQWLEQIGAVRVGTDRVNFQYAVRKRPAEFIAGPSFRADVGLYGSGTYGCTATSGDPNYPLWCGSEAGLIQSTEQFLATKWPGCTISGSSVLDDYEPYLNNSSSGTSAAVTSDKRMRTRASCTAGADKDFKWNVLRRNTLHCTSGFSPTGGPAPDDTLADFNHCRPHNNDVASIQGDLKQCSTCAASANPVYPATGEKARAEPDFQFAGRTFTRYYHSLRQFRPAAYFAVGWSHSYSDSVRQASSTAPIELVSEDGYFEAFVSIGNAQFRGENSTDRIMQRVNANGIGWRLREPDGQVREYDTSGRLIALLDPTSPTDSVSLSYLDNRLATITDGSGRQLRFSYGTNRLLRIDLPDGSQIGYAYDAALNLVGVDYGSGVTRQYHYNEPGLAGAADQVHHLTGISAENGRRFGMFSYDAQGRVTESRVLGTPNEVTTVSYPSADQSTVQTAAGGIRSYTSQAGIYRRLLARSDSAGTESSSYDSSGRLQSQTDKRNTVTQFEYQPGYLSALVQAVGTPEQRRSEYTRDSISQRLTQTLVRDASGTVRFSQQWTYNSRGQVLTERLTDPQTSAARTTTTSYCEATDIAAATCPLVGLVTTVDGPREAPVDDLTRYSYRMTDDPACTTTPASCSYRKGDLWKITDALGHVTETLHNDGAGRALSVRDANGVVVDFEYNARGWLTARKLRGSNDSSETDDRILRMDYTASGQLARIVDAAGTATHFAYDTADRLLSVTDNSGNRIQYTLNAAGERVQEDTHDATGVLRRTLSRFFNDLGQLQSSRDAYGHDTKHSYDADGNTTRVVDARGYATNQQFDPLARLVSHVRDAAGLAQTSLVKFDVLNRPSQIADPNGNPTHYTYDAFGNVLTRSSPDSATTHYSYDSAGNRSSQTDARGITASYGYDAVDRLIATSYPDSSLNATRSYDSAANCPAGETFAKGRLSRIVDGSGSTDYCYNRFGDLVRKVVQTNGKTFMLRYHYAVDGRLQGMRYPSGTEVDYVYDTQGRIREIGVLREGAPRQRLVYDATYHPFGAVAQWRYANGRVMQRDMDLNYRPSRVADAAEAGIDYNYEFDAVGNFVRLRSSDPAQAPRRNYTYDSIDRLSSSIDGGTQVVDSSYTYDRNGNRLSAGNWIAVVDTDPEEQPGDPGGGTPAWMFQIANYSYAAGTNRLTGVDSVLRGYDAAGNLTTLGDGSVPAGQTQFVYNAAGRLATVNRPGASASYYYNDRGEQVRRNAGSERYFIYGENGEWLAEHDDSASEQAIQEIIWLDNLPVGVLKRDGNLGRLYYVQPDALGTPRIVIDPTRGVEGLAVWNWDLAGEPFGNDSPQQDPDGDGTPFEFDLRFPGQRHDAFSGLNYNYYRDYEPGTGRYVQSDPIGLAGGSNTYAYADGKPMVQVDLYGLRGGMARTTRSGAAGMPGRQLQPRREPPRPVSYFSETVRDPAFWEALGDALDNEWWPAARYKDLPARQDCRRRYCTSIGPAAPCYAPWAGGSKAIMSGPNYRPTHCYCLDE